MGKLHENIAYSTKIEETRKGAKMSGKQLCKQVSFETPQLCPDNTSSSVFCFDVPVPEVPHAGAKVKVSCAGVCCKRRQSEGHVTPPPTPSIRGLRDNALFPGFEAAGVVEELGPNVDPNCGISEGDRVIVYPHGESGVIDGTYAEYLCVPEVECLVKVPESIPMQVACLLPTGALWALNAIRHIQEHVSQYIQKNGCCNILLVGTGGLALWLLRIIDHIFSADRTNVNITIAVLQDESIHIAQSQGGQCKVVSWSEDVHEQHLIERSIKACNESVNIIIDYAPTPRFFQRSLKCIQDGGVIVLGGEAREEGLFKRYDSAIQEKHCRVQAVPMGSREQLVELVQLVAENKVVSPTYKVFHVEGAEDVLDKLSKAQLVGRGVLEFTE